MRKSARLSGLGLAIAAAGLACVLASCGGDYEAAVADVTFVPAEPDAGLGQGQVPPYENLPPVDDPQVVPEDPETPEPPDTPEDPEVTDPPDDPEVVDPPEDPEVTDPPDDPIIEDPPYDPPWTEHDDPTVEGCLEAFPAICNKLDECSADMPILGLVSGFCPTAFDLASPLLSMGCEQVADLLNQALPDMSIPFIGGDVAGLVTDLLTGCIENFDCDPASILEFGQKLGEIVQSMGGLGALTGGGSGGGGDFMAALPALLELADMCGGLDLLPF